MIKLLLSSLILLFFIFSPSLPLLALSESSPPDKVIRIKEDLDQYNPEILIQSPRMNEVINNESFDLVVKVKGWPLGQDDEIKKGINLVLQVDDSLPISFTKLTDENIVIPLKEMTPGSHRIAVYAAYPWGEAVKKINSSDQIVIHLFEKVEGSQPEEKDVWITAIVESVFNKDDPFLIDFLIWNAPLQGIYQGDDKWRLKVSVNGQSIYMDRQEAIWLDKLSLETNVIQFQLLDLKGDLINPIFNNKIKIIKSNSLNTSSPYKEDIIDK